MSKRFAGHLYDLGVLAIVVALFHNFYVRGLPASFYFGITLLIVFSAFSAAFKVEAERE